MNGKRSILSIRLLLFGEAVVFLIAAFVHTGLWIDGYRHREARIAESVLAGALYAGLGLSWLRPLWTRKVGLAVQGFALAGTLIGLLTIAVGAGPQTIPDILYHLGMVGLLSSGLLYTIRTPARARKQNSHGHRMPHSVLVDFELRAAIWYIT